MFKSFIILSSLMLYTLYASQSTLLRENKRDIIREKKSEIEANAKKIKYDSIAPLNLSSSYSKSSMQDEAVSDSSLSINQDIFRSGAILYRIEYADIKRESSLSSLALENSSLYASLFTALLEYKKLQLLLKQNHFTLLNSEIEVFLKTQQYQAGSVDITELNRALREKNTALKAELLAKQALVEKEIELAKLSDVEISTIEIPHFSLILEEEYQEGNYNRRVASLNKGVSNKEYQMTKSSYLPTVSINGAYGYLDNPNTNFSDDYYSVGATLSMPLYYNRAETLQESRAIYLQSALNIQESEIEADALYKAGVSKIKNYKAYKLVTQDNINLYTKLIDITQKALNAGIKTGYDLQTLQNTKKNDELELQISDINIQIELAKLIFATTKGENYYE